MPCRGAVLFAGVLGLLAPVRHVAAQVNIDGGRSQLPGMKQDMFDQHQRSKRGGNQRPQTKGPPDCPKSDKMSPFWGLAFVNGEMYVKINSTSDRCVRLSEVGGANYTTLTNASRTCGPAGEWKRRIAEELSAVFFQGGLEWVKHEGENILVDTEDGVFELSVNEEKYAAMSACWARGCDCEQSKNPIGRAILFTLLAIGVIGLGGDGFKVIYDKFSGKKPNKHVLSKKGHKLIEKASRTRICDVCGKPGTHYQCSGGSQYDMCKTCYKAAKKKVKAALETWYEKHPEEKIKDEQKKKDKKNKGEKGDSDDDQKSGTEKSEGEKSGTEGEKSSKADDEKTEDEKSEKSDAESKSEADKES